LETFTSRQLAVAHKLSVTLILYFLDYFYGN
jgi:hypothetical protein